MLQNKKWIGYLFLALFILLSCRKNTESRREKNNQPPQVEVGQNINIILPTDSAELRGNAKDPDGVIVSYEWNKISGPSQFLLVNKNSPITTVKKLVEGKYVFELKATDNGGLSAVGNIYVMVYPDGKPIANAGLDQVIYLPADSAILDGSGSSDPGGKIVSYEWVKESGPSQAVLINNKNVFAKATNLVTGIYQFSLKVTDNSGFTAIDNMFVKVYPRDTTATDDPCFGCWDY